jgi:hypothetical protein
VEKGLPYVFRQTAKTGSIPMTARQRQVLTLWAMGESREDMAAICNVKEDTIKYHVTQVCHSYFSEEDESYTATNVSKRRLAFLILLETIGVKDTESVRSQLLKKVESTL